MADKRTKQLQKASNKSDARRAMAYDILKHMAQSQGIPLPNARNGGVEFDKWLAEKLTAAKAAKDCEHSYYSTNGILAKCEKCGDVDYVSNISRKRK